MRSLFAAVAFLLASLSFAPSAPAEQPVAVTEAFATTPDGIRLYYRVAGNGEQVVLAPFALYHGSALDPLADGRRVVTYDPRGRGRSAAAPLDKVSLDHLLIDLDTVRQAVGAETVAIVGWSGAGMEMFVYALRNPDRVSRLVQLAPVAPRIDPHGTAMMRDREARTDAAARTAYLASVERGAYRNDPEAQCRARTAVTGPALMFDASKRSLVPDVCGFANEHPETVGAYFGALFKSIDGYDWREELPQVVIPRLVVHGAQDNIPLAGNEEWVRSQPNARLLVVGKSGHFPHYENPGVTLPAIDRFLDGEWPPEARAIP